MSDLSFKPYRDAFDAYKKDIEQLTGIGDRLTASAEGVQNENIAPTAKLDKLNTIKAQIEKLPQAFSEAQNRFDAAVDVADAAIVEKFRALCSYAVGTGQADAGTLYLLEECRAYDRAKGDFKARHALYGQIVDISASVADACAGKQASSGSSILDQYEAITDPEAQSRFHSKHRDQLFAAYDARINQNTQSDTKDASN